MTDRERAVNYIRIFVGLGDNWRSCAPVDGVATGRGVRIGSCEVWPSFDEPGVWFLDDGRDIQRFGLSVKS
jgi:hypothetical protein